MLLTLLQQNLGPTCRVSWAQLVALPTATLSASNPPDTLVATASGQTRVKVSWAQFAPGVATTLLATGSPDILVSTASLAPAVARVSWAQFRQDNNSAFVVGALSPDILVSSASTARVLRVSWIQFSPNPGLTATFGAVDGDSLQASASVQSASDSHVAGTWSPALRARWVVLDTPNPPPIVVTLAASGSADLMTASATAVPPTLTASLVATEGAQTLVASLVPSVLPDDVPAFGGAPDEVSDLERALLERINHRAKLQVEMNNALALSLVSMLCTGEIE